MFTDIKLTVSDDCLMARAKHKAFYRKFCCADPNNYLQEWKGRPIDYMTTSPAEN